jgi:hypothetical protein
LKSFSEKATILGRHSRRLNLARLLGQKAMTDNGLIALSHPFSTFLGCLVTKGLFQTSGRKSLRQCDRTAIQIDRSWNRSRLLQRNG